MWEDEGAGLLISREELEERGCSACAWEVDLWEQIVEATGSALYGQIARRALDLDAHLKARPWAGKEVSAEEWEYVQAVRYERDRYSAQKQHQQRQEAEERARAGR